MEQWLGLRGGWVVVASPGGGFLLGSALIVISVAVPVFAGAASVDRG
jgi:hypothetical protein